MLQRLPPQVPGLPLLHNALEFRSDPVGLIWRGYELYGPMFAIALGPKRFAVLLGPENNRFFFEQTGKLLSIQKAYQFLIPMFGDKFLFVVDDAEYKEQRAIILPSFQGRRLDGYLEAMVRETNEWLATLGDEGAFPLVDAMGSLAIFLTIRAIVGEDFRRRAGAEFWDLFQHLSGGVEYLLPPNLPLPRFRRRDRAKLRLHSMLSAIIAERRRDVHNEQDFIQVLSETTFSNGELLPDATILGMILGMVYAGQENMTGHISWALIHLLQNPGYLIRVLDEQEALFGPGPTLDVAVVRKLNRLEWALKETERLQSSIRIIVRYTDVAYDLDGYHVPRGWLTMISPAVSHRLPTVFTDPERYDPERFSPERAEDRKSMNSLIGFGGGLHRCLGVHFAYTSMKVILTLLLQRYTLELVDPAPASIPGPAINRPRKPCLVRYRRRESRPRGHPTLAADVVIAGGH